MIPSHKVGAVLSGMHEAGGEFVMKYIATLRGVQIIRLVIRKFAFIR